MENPNDPYLLCCFPLRLSVSVSVSVSPHFLPVLALRCKLCICFRVATGRNCWFWHITQQNETFPLSSTPFPSTPLFSLNFCPSGEGMLLILLFCNTRSEKFRAQSVFLPPHLPRVTLLFLQTCKNNLQIDL